MKVENDIHFLNYTNQITFQINYTKSLKIILHSTVQVLLLVKKQVVWTFLKGLPENKEAKVNE